MKLNKGKFYLIKYYCYVIVIADQMLLMTRHYSKQNEGLANLNVFFTVSIPYWS